jgi:hypothetical protein
MPKLYADPASWLTKLSIFHDQLASGYSGLINNQSRVVGMPASFIAVIHNKRELKTLRFVAHIPPIRSSRHRDILPDLILRT